MQTTTNEFTGEMFIGTDTPLGLTPFIRTAYNYDRNAASDETGLSCPEPTLAQQQFKEETDINTIVERFGLTGELPNNVRIPIQEEFVETTTFHEAMQTIRDAEQAFMRLPAHVRAEFNNDAGRLVDFVSDERNRERAEALGLVTRKTPEPTPAPKEPGVT